MLKFNLGCGDDIRPGYVNVDFRRTHRDVVSCDLSKFPWPFNDSSAKEVLMFDFLEHFEHTRTKTILAEVWRILIPEGFVDIQVPDFEHCARAVLNDGPYMCNSCGARIDGHGFSAACPGCGVTTEKIGREAVRRLYGGQDYVGNYHMTAFTRRLLEGYLVEAGFDTFMDLEVDHQTANWNFKVRAHKKADAWT